LLFLEIPYHQIASDLSLVLFGVCRCCLFDASWWCNVWLGGGRGSKMRGCSLGGGKVIWGIYERGERRLVGVEEGVYAIL
jgi:hypothetical protein